MKRHVLKLALALGLTSPLVAHHSLALYDNTKIVTIQGEVTKVQWTNPHAWIFLSLKNNDGAVVEQTIEIAPPHALTLKGFDKNVLAIGSVVSFEVWLPRNPQDPLRPTGRFVTLADGRRFDVGDSLGWSGAPERRTN
jgi:hypothetical protein